MRKEEHTHRDIEESFTYRTYEASNVTHEPINDYESSSPPREFEYVTTYPGLFDPDETDDVSLGAGSIRANNSIKANDPNHDIG